MSGMRSIRQGLRDRYSVDKVAEAMGVTRKTIASWENRPETMKYVDAKKLARYYGCKVEDLFSRDGE